MKRITIITCIAIGTSGVFSACQKGNMVTPANQRKNTNQQSQIQMGQDPSVSMIYVPALGTCTYPAANCTRIPTITIHGSAQDYANSLIQAQINGAPAVASLFKSSDFKSVCEAIGSIETSKLQSGSYVIKVTCNNSDYVTFIAQKDSVSNDNLDFAVQLNVQ